MATGAAGRTLKLTISACVLLAALAIVISASLGHWQQGTTFAAGLLLGSLNGVALSASVGAEAGFRATSMLRLAVLSALAIAVGIAIGGGVAVAALGVAIAQVVLAGSALVETVRR